MLDFIYSLLRKKYSPKFACSLINSGTPSDKKVRKTLKKAGVVLDNATILPPFFFDKSNIQIGNDSFINTGNIFISEGGIFIGKKTLIGPRCNLCTTTHPTQPELRHSGYKISPINIGDNVWIGANVTILPGITIGDNSIIAAGSVVTENVPNNVVYAGVPAKMKSSLNA